MSFRSTGNSYAFDDPQTRQSNLSFKSSVITNNFRPREDLLPNKFCRNEDRS